MLEGEIARHFWNVSKLSPFYDTVTDMCLSYANGVHDRRIKRPEIDDSDDSYKAVNENNKGAP
jgi:hypothetical protein